MKSKKNGIGIDFGTTTSVAVLYDKTINKSKPLTAKGTGLPHPSVVWYKADGQVIVGAEAKKHIEGFSTVEGNHFISSIKRRLGRDKNVSIFGQHVDVTSVASEIFKHLKKEAKASYGLGEIEEAVVTIPIYFNGISRRELRKAANKAGIFIKKFVHEPFAAILGYFHKDGEGINLHDKEGQLILVFDWGGGTLDVTVTKVVNGGLVELSTAGIPDRAGDHFDHEIVKYVKNGLIEKLNASPEEILIFPSNKDRLKYECEIKKIQLSNSKTVNIEVARLCKYAGVDQNVRQPLTQKEFNNLIKLDISDAIMQVHKALEDANVTANSIDTALLIGGTSRIPYIRDQLRELFGHRIIEVDNADTIIAEGAAIVDGLNLQTVLARSVNIQLSDGSTYEVFKAGDVASKDICSKTVNFFCTDNRDSQAKLVISEQSGNIFETRTIVKKVLPIPISGSAFDYERITVIFAIDEDLVLHVSAKAATQRQPESCEIYDLCFGLQL